MEPLASQLASELQLSAGDCFAFFGHSMGALVSFEVARRLEERGLSGPVMLFASGCAAPQVFDINPKIHDLPDDEFTRRLKSLEGTPPEVLAHQELMSLVLPALRADFAVCETNQYCSGKPLDCPVFAWGGSADPEVDFEALEPWREQTSKKFSMKILEGRHFFLHDQWPAMVRTLNRMLSPWCTPANHVLAPPGGRCSSQRTGRSGLHTQTQHSTRRGSVRQHRI
jgi:medium-chain acyl-[acyl-carrier-protein] hydrolase